MSRGLGGGVVTVEPSGSISAERGGALIEVPTWRPTRQGQALMFARVRRELTMAAAARRLGLERDVLAGLEDGSLTFRDPRDWERAAARLRQ